MHVMNEILLCRSAEKKIRSLIYDKASIIEYSHTLSHI